MPRGSRSSGRSSFGGRSASPSTATRQSVAASRPMPAQTQPQTQQSGGFLSGIGSTIMSGMAFGAGSEVAHQAVRSIMGGGSHSHSVEQQPANQQQVQSKPNPCQSEMDNFSKCLSSNDNIGYCQNFSDSLKNCRSINNLL